jgi:hypothetical protein
MATPLQLPGASFQPMGAACDVAGPDACPAWTEMKVPRGGTFFQKPYDAETLRHALQPVLGAIGGAFDGPTRVARQPSRQDRPRPPLLNARG